MRVALRHKQRHLVAEVIREGGRYRVTLDGQEQLVDVDEIDEASLVLTLDGRHYSVALARDGRDRLVGVRGEVYTFTPESGVPSAHHVATLAAPEITAPMPGKVLQVLVQPGDHVAAGDGVLILEAMKMESRLTAEAAGVVIEVRVGAGDMVDGGQVLIVLAYDEAAPG